MAGPGATSAGYRAMPDLLPITLTDMIEEIEVELAFRARVFPRRMEGAGLAMRNYLHRRIEVMQAIKKYLEQRKDDA